MISIISTLIAGLVIGALARLVVPGRQAMSIWLTLVVGVVAALIGLFIANSIGLGTVLTFVLQVALAALGVAALSGVGARTRS